MDVRPDDHEILEVGLSASIESYCRDHLPTQILGWDKGEFIIVRVAYMEGKPAPLTSHDKCKLRFIKDGIVYGFKTEILSIQFSPGPVMFLKYPDAVEHVGIRRFDRAKTNIAARLSDLKGTFTNEAVITDLSEGGCAANVNVMNGPEFTPEEECKIAFNVMDTNVEARCMIRKIRKAEGAYFLGLAFGDISSAEKKAINSLLELSRKYLKL